jgi:hypothetical protein
LTDEADLLWPAGEAGAKSSLRTSGNVIAQLGAPRWTFNRSWYEITSISRGMWRAGLNVYWALAIYFTDGANQSLAPLCRLTSAGRT